MLSLAPQAPLVWILGLVVFLIPDSSGFLTPLWAGHLAPSATHIKPVGPQTWASVFLVPECVTGTGAWKLAASHVGFLT